MRVLLSSKDKRYVTSGSTSTGQRTPGGTVARYPKYNVAESLDPKRVGTSAYQRVFSFLVFFQERAQSNLFSPVNKTGPAVAPKHCRHDGPNLQRFSVGLIDS